MATPPPPNWTPDPDQAYEITYPALAKALQDVARSLAYTSKFVTDHGPCICDTNPATTDGPQEDCPHHGRPYSYWVEAAGNLSTRISEARAALDQRPSPNAPEPF